SRLARFHGDLGWKGTDAEIHLVTSAADNFFGVIGTTPVELLANDYRAIYTWPQTTKNEAALVALNGRYSVTDHWTVPDRHGATTARRPLGSYFQRIFASLLRSSRDNEFWPFAPARPCERQ